MRRTALGLAFAAAALAGLLLPAAALGHEVLHSVEPGRAWAVKLRFGDGEPLA